jgi:hypothetical protein
MVFERQSEIGFGILVFWTRGCRLSNGRVWVWGFFELVGGGGVESERPSLAALFLPVVPVLPDLI